MYYPMRHTAASQLGPCTSTRVNTMQTKAKTKPANAIAQLAATVVATPQVVPAPVKSIALRGGPAITQVALTGAVYRTTAPHNMQWWQALTAQLAAGPAPVAGLLLTPAQPAGVPAHFVGYALRRGYLKAVA